MFEWLTSIDARDIGILYLILSIFSIILGTMMSMLIKFLLNNININSLLDIANFIYDNLITVYAFFIPNMNVIIAMLLSFGFFYFILFSELVKHKSPIVRVNCTEQIEFNLGHGGSGDDGDNNIFKRFIRYIKNLFKGRRNSGFGSF